MELSIPTKTVTYKFVDGTESTAIVSDELAAIIAQLDKEEKNNNRSETRRHTSLEWLSKRKDTEIVDRGVNLEADFILREDIITLRKAMEFLTPDQKELVYKRLYERKSFVEIAKEYGVSRQAIKDRFTKIINKLKKVFESSGVE